MKSQLKAMLQRHRDEIEALRKSCSHDEKSIKIRLDRSVIGCGTGHPAVHVVCRNCGCMKIIFELDADARKTVRKTMDRQGFKDERISTIQYEYELDGR